jgi:hypothetical protein
MKILVPWLIVVALAIVFVEDIFGWGKMTIVKWLVIFLLTIFSVTGLLKKIWL